MIDAEWTLPVLKDFEEKIAKIASYYELDTFPVQIEIINSMQMMDAYSTVGMPLAYHHWSFGKQYLNIEKNYRRGLMGLAYEIVINSNPCIAYLMEENTTVMQATVIAHACYGHNSFFKNNYLFKTWTNPESIIDYFMFSRKYIAECEEKYGLDAVESILDSCHALMNQGVDKYKRPQALSLQEEKARQKAREAYLQSQVNDLWRTIPNYQTDGKNKKEDEYNFPREPQENILYFIEKNAPLLEPWQREIVRIVRKIAQYFYPQRQTKVMNEGWASFWHYTIINKLYDDGEVDDNFMLEFMHNHTNLLFQPDYNDQRFSGLNPYTLGFNMYMDIKRICEEPTDEDKQWFPDIAGSDWLETLDFAMRNFKDESFISQFLSPHLIREMRLFNIIDDDKNDDILVHAIHNEQGYQRIREELSNQYNISQMDPDIQITKVDIRGDRSLTLRHLQNHRRPLDENSTNEVLKHVHRLWGFPVYLNITDSDQKILQSYHCPPQAKALVNDDENNKDKDK